MSVTAWSYLFVALTFGAYLLIGYRNRVKDTEGFYVAERGVPAIFNGAATAADWMSAASFISMAGLISFMGFDGAVYLMGWTGGYVLLALLFAPYLRRFGKYTVPDFVGDRYGSDLARVVAAICALFVSLTYVAGQMRGVGVVFSRFLGVGIGTGVMIGMAIVAFFAVLGGMKGITWTQVTQYGVLILAYLIPAGAIAYRLTGNPIPQLSLATSDIAQRLDLMHQDLGFAAYTEPFQSMSMLDVFCITFALMAGTAGLPHILVRFYTVPNVRAARYSAGWALVFIVLLYTTAPALAAFARLNLLETLHGKEISAARSLSWVESWERTGLLAIDDRNGDGVLQFSPDVSQSDLIIDRDIIVLSTPEVAGLAPWVIALVVAGGLAAALSTAAGLLLVISSSIAHDIYAKLIRPEADEAQKLLVGRLMIFAAVVVAGYFGYRPPGFVGEVVAFAFGLAAATFFPILLLGIFDKRTNRWGAISGMAVGLLFTGSYIVSNRFFGVEPWCFGISAQGIGTVGLLLNLVATWTVSRLTEPPEPELQELVERLRSPGDS